MQLFPKSHFFSPISAHHFIICHTVLKYIYTYVSKYIKLFERPQYKLISFFISDVFTITTMFESKQGKCHSSIVPKKQGKKNKNVPPLMTMSDDINNSRNNSFGKFGDVKEKSTSANHVHNDDSWEHRGYQGIIYVGIIEENPVNSRNNAVNGPECKKSYIEKEKQMLF